jgi:hypothetical protein
MTQALHSQARTNPIVRDEIRASVLSQAELASTAPQSVKVQCS